MADLNPTAREQLLAQMQDMSLRQELLVEKWSKFPTFDSRTGKVKYTNWLEAEEIGHLPVPKLTSDKAKRIMAMILENQFRFQMERTAEVRNGRVLIQDTADADLALPTKYSLPIVRRIYAQVIEADFLV